MMHFNLIKGSVIKKYLKDVSLIKHHIRQAYIFHGEGKTINPDSYFLKFIDNPQNRIIALPSYIGGEYDVSGIKWIASYPNNVQNKLVRASAVLILNDATNGFPIACLESSIISATRTAASAILTAEIIKPEKTINKLGFVGNGLIAQYIYNFLLEDNWNIKNIELFDINKGAAESFKHNVIQSSNHKTNIYDNMNDMIQNCDFIVFATVASVPYLTDINLLSHNPTILHLSLRDISPEIILKSNNFTDDVDHVLKANTSLHLASKKTKNKDFINGTVYDLIKSNYKLDLNKPTIFSPFGLGVLDLALGKYVYKKSIRDNDVISINDFFYKTQRHM